MEAPQPETVSAHNGAQHGTEPGFTTQEGDTGEANAGETNQTNENTNFDRAKEEATVDSKEVTVDSKEVTVDGKDHVTPEGMVGDPGAANQDLHKDHVTSEGMVGDPGAANQDLHKDHVTSEVMVGDPGAANQNLQKDHMTSEGMVGDPGAANQDLHKDHVTSEVMVGDPGASNQNLHKDHVTSEVMVGDSGAANQDLYKDHATSEVMVGDPGAASQDPHKDHATGESVTTNLESSREHATNEEYGSTEEPGDTNQGPTHGEQTSNQEAGRQPDTTDMMATNQEPATSELMGAEEAKTGIDQDTTTEHQKVDLSSTERDTTTEEEEEMKVTSRYLKTPEEQDDLQYQQEDPENPEDEPAEDHEQWGQDAEPQDSSDDTPEDEHVREALIQEYQTLVLEKEKVQQQNSQLQHKLYEYFRRKKGEDTRPEMEKHVPDQEQRYLKYLATLEEMRRKFKADAILHEQQIEELRVQCQNVVSQVDKEWAAFQEQRKKIALYVGNRGAGKHAASSFAQEVEQLQAKEERKEKEVIQVRLENIKLKNQIQRYESTLRSKEELADGLHQIDFEQLKIENQTYNEKIEERNEELQKLRKKITNTVQVLTHFKEKLQFVQAENQEQKDRLMEIEALVAHRRDILTRTKQARDSLRMDNLNLKQKCGLLGNTTLLRDFEEKVDASEELRQKLESLKRRHAELTLSTKGVMKKIEDTKIVIES